MTGTMCILRPRSCSEGHNRPKVDSAILPNTCVTCNSDAVLPTFANKEEDIQTSKVVNSQTMSEMQAKAVVRLARMQRDLTVVSSLEDSSVETLEEREVMRRSWLTSSSVLLAFHSPLLASLLHPGADGLSLPFALPTLDSLLAWLHGEVDMMGEEVEEAAKWLGIHTDRPAEKPQKPPHLTSKSHQDQGHLLPEVIVSMYNSEADSDSENEEVVEEEMEEPECDKEDLEEVFFDSREQESCFRDSFEDEIKNRSTPMFSANDTFDALNFDFSYFCGEEEKEPELAPALTCDQCGQIVCDQCGYRATAEEDLIEHKNSMHRCVHYSCNQCDYESARSDDLTEHMHSQHEGIFIKLFASVFRN